MIRNITIASAACLFAFLLAASNPQIAPYAIFVAVLAFGIGWLFSFDYNKQLTASNEHKNKYLSALNKLSELESRNADLITSKQDEELKAFELLRNEILEFKANQEKIVSNSIENNKEIITVFKNELTANLSNYCNSLETIVNNALRNNTESIQQFIDKQELSNEIFEKNNQAFSVSIIAFKTAISSYADLTQAIKTDFEKVLGKFEELADKTIISNQESTKAILTSIEQITEGVAATMDATTKCITGSTAKNISATNQLMQNVESMLKLAMQKVAENIEQHYIDASSSLMNTYQTTVEKHTKTIKEIINTIIDAIEELKLYNSDINESVQNMNRSIRNTIDNINEDFANKADESSDVIKESIEKLKFDLKESINLLSDELTSIAVNSTNYKEEKEIIQRLERLCKK